MFYNHQGRVLTPELAAALHDAGQRPIDIATEFYCSPQNVNYLLRKAGVASVRETISNNMPWQVNIDFRTNLLCKSLRCHARYMVLGPEKTHPDYRKRAEVFQRKLATYDVVVDYNPEYPPMPGQGNTPGFKYVSRTDDDEDFVIKRSNAHITPIGNKIWRLPPK